MINIKQFYKKLSSGLIISSAVLLAACGGDVTSDSDSLSSDSSTQLAYVERPTTTVNAVNEQRFEAKLRSKSESPLEFYSPYGFNPGARLFDRNGLDIDGENTEILSAYFGSSVYDVKDLNVSPDGSRMVFAAHGPTSHDTDYTWNIYEYDFATSTIHRIIKDDAIANSGQDTNPTYTQDGKIVFSSDRSSGNPDSPVVNIVEDAEYCYKIGPKEKPSLLHSMSAEGENILQLTYGNNHDTHPTTLKDGRVAFIRHSYAYTSVERQCENVAKARSAQELLRGLNTDPVGFKLSRTWSANAACQYSQEASLGDDSETLEYLTSNRYTLLRLDPEDGSLDQLYKTVKIDHSDDEFVYVDRIVQGESGRLLGVLRRTFNNTSSNGGTIVDFESPVNTNIHNKFGDFSVRSVTGDVEMSPSLQSKPGWFSAVWPYRDNTSRMLVSWAQCYTSEGGVSDLCSEGQGDISDVKYGIWVFGANSETRTEVIRADNGKTFDDLVINRPHQSLEFPFEPYQSPFIDNLDDSRIVCNYPEPENTPPTASAGDDQSVYVGTEVQLSGSAQDADNDLLTYTWTIDSQPEGSTATLSEPSITEPTFVADQEGTYNLTFTVSDGTDTVQDSLSVIATVEEVNSAPQVSAGDNQSVPVQTLVNLDGTASDEEGSTLTYQWTLVSAPGGLDDSIVSDADSVSASFTPPVPGDYQFEFTANDGELSSSDSVTITAYLPNRAPIADAGPGGAIDIRSTVSPNASASDPDGDALSYSWIALEPSELAISNANSLDRASFVTANYGTYRLQLRVSDGNLSTTDTVTFTASNVKPTANAGDDIVRDWPISEPIMPSGSGSDAHNDDLSYSWTITSAPEGSSASLDNAASTQPSFTTDMAGAYTLQLIVNDGLLDSDPSTMTITLNEAENSAPTVDAGEGGEVDIHSTVSSSATASDADDDTLTYTWTAIQPEGLVITNPSSLDEASFVVDNYGTYELQLAVDDGTVTITDTVVYTATNVQPTANAGDDIVRDWPISEPIVPSGSGSDVHNDDLSYSWTITSAPEGSNPSLDNSTSTDPTFTTDMAGVYELQLTVNDGLLDSDPSTMTITLNEAGNNPPTVDAGEGGEVDLESAVTLSGTASDPDENDTLTYAWTAIQPGDLVITNPSSLDGASFVADSYGTYELQLAVSDGTVTVSDTVIFTASNDNQQPVADAGPDQLNTTVDDLLTLDGSGSYDLDSDTLSYLWEIIQAPEGSTASLNDDAIVNPQITVDAEGDYIISLVVNDGTVDSEPDTMVISTAAKNVIPVAVASNVSANIGGSAVLDGSNSYDPDGDDALLSYDWSLIANPEGSGASLTNGTSASPELVGVDLHGDYTVQLIVNDGTDDSLPLEVIVSTANLAPVADAGEALSGDVYQVLSLDGSGSYDPDGDAITYSWAIINAPEGSDPQLTDASTVAPSFASSTPGIYVAQLIVNDSMANSEPPATVTIQVSAVSCEMNTATSRTLPVIIRDFKPWHPDFEILEENVGLDPGIVREDLGEDGKPVYIYEGDEQTTRTTSGETYFKKWYNTVLVDEGYSDYNREIPVNLTMTRESANSMVWSFIDTEFFPIDDGTLPEGYTSLGNTWLNGEELEHNYHFTLETHLQFYYDGGEKTFRFTGDDDLFVFINGKLALDLGGVHPPVSDEIVIDEAMASYLGIEPGNTYSFDLFFAERRTVQSNFQFETNLNLDCLPGE